MKLAANLRFDALLYICNVLVAILPSSAVRHCFYRHVMGIKMAPGSHILSGLWLDGRRGLKIGRNSIINQRCRLDNRGGISIGDNVSISPEVHIITADHDLRSPVFAGRQSTVEVGDYVFIGSRAIILPGVIVGEGAAIGAGAVVTHSVAAWTIVAGIPAVKIMDRPIVRGYRLEGARHFF